MNSGLENVLQKEFHFTLCPVLSDFGSGFPVMNEWVNEGGELVRNARQSLTSC